jgi:hypothetical protein
MIVQANRTGDITSEAGLAPRRQPRQPSAQPQQVSICEVLTAGKRTRLEVSPRPENMTERRVT